MSELVPRSAELLMRWSVRLAVAFYLGRVGLDIWDRGKSPSQSHDKFARWFWTIGYLLYVVHVVCAFAFFHDWSHDRAYDHTAAQTEALTGIRWGGGLYFNYIFTLLWSADTIAWWTRTWWTRGASSHDRTRSYYWILHGVFAFMVFNATIVFGPPGWRPVGLMVGVALAIIYVKSRKRRAIGD